MSIQRIFNILAIICDDRKLRVTVLTSFEGALLTGASTFLGGLLGGPRGLAVGGLVGGLLAATALEDFQPVSKVLKEMDPQQKQKLYEKLKEEFMNFGISDVAGITVAMLSQTDLQELAVREAMKFLTQDLGYKAVAC